MLTWDKNLGIHVQSICRLEYGNLGQEPRYSCTQSICRLEYGNLEYGNLGQEPRYSCTVDERKFKSIMTHHWKTINIRINTLALN